MTTSASAALFGQCDGSNVGLSSDVICSRVKIHNGLGMMRLYISSTDGLVGIFKSESIRGRSDGIT